MTDAMAHRGPDAHSDYVHGRVALGHRRLSIIDLSDAANQPFTDHSGRYRIIFNGEIYNFSEVKKLITDYPFVTSGDTEVLLAAYIRWGAGCLQYLKGMFAFAVWDEQEEVLFAARDRMGVKPFYYFVNENCFAFASEIRGIMASGLVPRRVNNAGIREFLSYQSIGTPLSAIDHIVQLDAGCCLTIRGTAVSVKRYWDIADYNRPGITDDKELIQANIRDLLYRSVERRLISDVPVGAFLSGGIDSSAVVAIMSEVSTTAPNTFTIGFNEKEYDESSYADIIAKKYKTNHNRILLKPQDFLAELTNGLDAMDIPSGDGINTYVVSKVIRQCGITVALSGIGGDELFAGYPFFMSYLQLNRYRKIWNKTGVLRKSAAGVLSLSGSNRLSRVQQLLDARDNTIAWFYPEFRRIISPQLFSRLIIDRGAHNTTLENHLQERSSAIQQFPLLSQVSLAEYMGYTQHTLLKDTDQMSMAVSLEVREPFFDHELIEYVLNVPDAIKFPHTPKSLLVDSLKGLLPADIVNRPKQGFLFPWSVWMKNELFTFCDAHIKRMAERDFVNGNELLNYWKKFLKGDKDVRWLELWLFVVLEYWMEKNGYN